MSKVNINKQYELPKIFNSINVKINQTHIPFDIVSYLSEVTEFNDVIKQMMKAPSMYSYFMNVKVEQNKLVRDLKDAMDEWYNQQYAKIQQVNAKATVTAIKAKISSIADENGFVQKRYNDKIKEEEYKLEKIEAVIKSLEKQMAMLQSIGAMKRYELEHLISQKGEAYSKEEGLVGVDSLEDI